MAKAKILIADDESRLRKLVRDYLVRDDYDVVEAEDGQMAMDLFCQDDEIALVLLDVMMPKKDGYQVLKEIREISKVPVIMLTAKGEESDVLTGFENGADEYVTKPFSPKILVARVNAVLRRSVDDGPGKTIIEAGGILLDIDAHVATNDGSPIELSVKEFELLYYFVSNPGKALSREMILNHVWDYDYFGDARTIDTHVKKLRSKLNDKGVYIKTIWGMGYKFEVE